MSELLNQLALNVLRTSVFDALPTEIQNLFPQVTDPLSGDSVPNIVLGHPSEQGSAPQYPMVCVSTTKQGDVTVPNIGHAELVIEVWVAAKDSLPTAARRVVSIIAEYVRQGFAQTNWGGLKVQIEKSWEIESALLFEPPEKLYHHTTRFGVEALSSNWY